MVRKHNLHKCAVAVNGCKKDISDRCRGAYSHTETINETYVDELTDRVVYQHWHHDDSRVVPYNLQMMMDWDSHINVEYSGSGHCVQYLWARGAIVTAIYIDTPLRSFFRSDMVRSWQTD
jgi:hypothetical protein